MSNTSLSFALPWIVASLIIVSIQPANACEMGAKQADGIPVYTGCPPQMRELMSRAIHCQRWGNTESRNAKHGEEISKALKKYQCNRLVGDYEAFEKAHETDARVHTTIDKTFLEYHVEF